MLDSFELNLDERIRKEELESNSSNSIIEVN